MASKGLKRGQPPSKIPGLNGSRFHCILTYNRCGVIFTHSEVRRPTGPAEADTELGQKLPHAPSVVSEHRDQIPECVVCVELNLRECGSIIIIMQLPTPNCILAR